MVGIQSERIYWVGFCRDLFFNILINSLAGRIENMFTKFIDDRTLRELENNYWTWIEQVILLESSKFRSRMYPVEPLRYPSIPHQDTTCKTCSHLFATYQAQALSCLDPACPRRQDRHGQMGENVKDNYMDETFKSREWKGEKALFKTKEDCRRRG